MASGAGPAALLLEREGADEVDVVEEAPLLVRASQRRTTRSKWAFAERCIPAESNGAALCRAALWPLHALALPAEAAALLGGDDPWHRHPAFEHVAAWLSESDSGDSPPLAPPFAPPFAPRLAPQRGAAAGREVGGQKRVLEGASAEWEAHPRLTSAHDPTSGRGLYANATLRAGELVLRERSSGVVLRREFAHSHCHHCLCALPLVCGGTRRCSGSRACPERYCSAACARNAWESGHAFECGKRHHRIAPVGAVLCVRLLLGHAADAGGEGNGGDAADTADAGGGAGYVRMTMHNMC